MYQLILKSQQGKYVLGDSKTVDLPAKTLEQAKEQAKEILYGDPSEWGVYTSPYNGKSRFRLSEGDTIYEKYGADGPVLGGEHIVLRASIVKVEMVFDLEPLKAQIQEAEKRLLQEAEKEKDLAELKRLQAKFGTSHE